MTSSASTWTRWGGIDLGSDESIPEVAIAPETLARLALAPRVRAVRSLRVDSANTACEISTSLRARFFPLTSIVHGSVDTTPPVLRMRMCGSPGSTISSS